MQVMLQEELSEIPEAHIMKRWTKNARDVIPAQLESYQKDKEGIQSTTLRHRLMRLQSENLVATRDMDIEMFEIVMKHMKNARQEAAELQAKRSENTGVVQDEDSSDDEVDCDVEDIHHGGVGVQSDGEVLRRKQYGEKGDADLRSKNKYGASGSSAHFSDSDIISVKAPVLKKISGCPRGKRFIAGSESSKKKWKKKNGKKKATSDASVHQNTDNASTNGNNIGGQASDGKF